MSSTPSINEQRIVDTLRLLSVDMVEQARSGHPGTAMALSPVLYVLYRNTLKHNPANPGYVDRDRFVLSCGHAAVVQYAALFASGYDLSLDDLRRFRQWGSKTPGHPERHQTPGVEMSTGPLGQGFATAVGLALAERHLAAVFNRPGFNLVDHHTYVVCSDGDLMEGVSHEAASLAGHLRLGKLIALYDDNRITIEGSTALSCSDDVVKRFEAYQWNVIDLGDRANDLELLRRTFEDAKAQTDRPTLIVLRTHIGFGSPNRVDSPKAHGEPLGPEETRLTKQALGFDPNQSFVVPPEIEVMQAEVRTRGAASERQWLDLLEAYAKAHPDLHAEWIRRQAGHLPPATEEAIASIDFAPAPLATRVASGKIIDTLGNHLPELIGGCADLATSTQTLFGDKRYLNAEDLSARNLAWGIREHGMAAATNGLALHGGLRPFLATYLVFSDYARPSLRMAALMQLPVIFIFTHDSIAVGEDGPTHQPVEQLASLRAMPNLVVLRPADAHETQWAWNQALQRRDGPTALVLSRQPVTTLSETASARLEDRMRGGYVLSAESSAPCELILLATGSEVELALSAQKTLTQNGRSVRVVSLPSFELFRAYPKALRDSVLPPSVRKRLAIEAASSLGWADWVGLEGEVISVTQFGQSAPTPVVREKFGFNPEAVVARAQQMLGAR